MVNYKETLWSKEKPKEKKTINKEKKPLNNNFSKRFTYLAFSLLLGSVLKNKVCLFFKNTPLGIAHFKWMIPSPLNNSANCCYKRD